MSFFSKIKIPLIVLVCLLLGIVATNGYNNLRDAELQEQQDIWQQGIEYGNNALLGQISSSLQTSGYVLMQIPVQLENGSITGVNVTLVPYQPQVGNETNN